ncbi:MAG: pilus assembly PilX N-terminal domain-containing protein [Candidatus Moranbacteria bacterium]|nr:pilus assembly PilX N-terminal domain-containing protein [Candidatus Moranbacteria bacterium]
MSKQKIVALGKKYRGSVLAYSLIILAMMLAIASSLSVATIIGKKSASGTEFSMQSLQTADSGVQLALKKLGAANATDTIAVALGSCNGVKFSSGNAAAGPDGSSYELTFFNEAGNQIDCSSAKVSDVRNIKSIGTYKNTVRAVNVAVAATGADVYQTTCTLTTNSPLACCKINQNTGATNCKASRDGNSSWSDIGSPWSAGTSGRYNIACAYNNGGLFCCKTDSMSGTASVCRYNSDFNNTNWSNFGSQSPW